MKDTKGKIKALIMDVDGTLTDGKVYMGASGELMKCFDIKDGYGIANLLPKAGIMPIIITGRKSDILLKRCEELIIIHVYQGVAEKRTLMKQILEELNIALTQVAYIGDDLNDMECMELVALTACPSDAVRQIKESVDYCCTCKGGNGAVREFIDYLLQ